jgi:predicted pyridoxine 5'-phosphate oxidase superfamily flavin-nucleotide-binding protein
VTSMYHDGQRVLQDAFDGRRVADVLEDRRKRSTFDDDDVAMIHAAPFFFLATAHDGVADCSFKGGAPGFVRVTGPDSLEWPDHDGNSMYRSLGNILLSPAVGLLFMTFDGAPARLRSTARRKSCAIRKSWRAITPPARWCGSPPRRSSRTARATFPT